MMQILSFLRISENDSFESVILESVKIKSVRVDRHPHSKVLQGLKLFFKWPKSN